MRYDVRLAGLGGQGLILAGMILGEAASIHAGLNAVQTQSYAPLVRGAPSMSEVIVSDAPIDFPVVEDADVLLALAQESFDAYAGRVRRGGCIIVPDAGVRAEAPPGVDLRVLPLIRAAQEAGAAPIAATLVGLAAVSRRLGIVPDEAIRAVVRMRVPREGREANLRALEAGFGLSG